LLQRKERKKERKKRKKERKNFYLKYPKTAACNASRWWKMECGLNDTRLLVQKSAAVLLGPDMSSISPFLRVGRWLLPVHGYQFVMFMGFLY
jgi:hypothetical protein